MNNFSITKCVSDAWDLAVKHWFLCIIVLVIGIVSSIISGIGSSSPVVTPDMDPDEVLRAYADMFSGVGLVTNLISMIVSSVLYAGFMKMAMNGYNGEKVDTNAYKMPFATYVKYIVGYVAYMVLFSAGLILCIVPGIFIGVRFMFVPVILLDESETDVVEAFRKSWSMTSGNFWTLFGLSLMAILLLLAGLVCCCIGVIFSVVILYFMWIIAYYYFKGNNNEVVAIGE